MADNSSSCPFFNCLH